MEYDSIGIRWSLQFAMKQKNPDIIGGCYWSIMNKNEKTEAPGFAKQILKNDFKNCISDSKLINLKNANVDTKYGLRLNQ